MPKLENGSRSQLSLVIVASIKGVINDEETRKEIAKKCRELAASWNNPHPKLMTHAESFSESLLASEPPIVVPAVVPAIEAPVVQTEQSEEFGDLFVGLDDLPPGKPTMKDALQPYLHEWVNYHDTTWTKKGYMPYVQMLVFEGKKYVVCGTASKEKNGGQVQVCATTESLKKLSDGDENVLSHTNGSSDKASYDRIQDGRVEKFFVWPVLYKEQRSVRFWINLRGFGSGKDGDHIRHRAKFSDGTFTLVEEWRKPKTLKASGG